VSIDGGVDDGGVEGGGGGGVLMRHITEEANLTGEVEHEKTKKPENKAMPEPRKPFAATSLRERRISTVASWREPRWGGAG
jgi:hypothetical protein